MPGQAEPMQLMADALDILGERTFNANVRNYTFSYAEKLRKKISKLKK
jgi:hypothetical protein